MQTNSLPSERAAVVAAIDPDANTAAAYVSDYVDAGLFPSLMAIVQAGALGTSATLDFKLVQATDSSGTGAKDITGKAITQLTDAGSDDDKQAIINCREDELDIANDFTHVRLSITVAVATSDGAGIILGHAPGTEPATDLASVDEIVE